METNEHKVQMLDNILDITHKLYQEMCTTESSAKDNHFEIFRLITKLGAFRRGGGCGKNPSAHYELRLRFRGYGD